MKRNEYQAAMKSWFDTSDFKHKWYTFFLLADQTMMKLPMRGWEPQWNRSRFPGGLAGMTGQLMMLQKAFYHLLLTYAYSVSANQLLRESAQERDRRFWDNERLYHFHHFFPRYRSFLDYAARFAAPLFDWAVLDDFHKECNRVYFESVRNRASALIRRNDVTEFEFISLQDAASVAFLN